jgi:hypothetical protein
VRCRQRPNRCRTYHGPRPIPEPTTDLLQSDDLADRVHRLHDSGLSTHEIAAEVGCSQGTVCNVLRDRPTGSPPPPPVPPGSTVLCPQIAHSFR